MTKKILALFGKGDSGKTTTIAFILGDLQKLTTGDPYVKRGNKRKGNLEREVLYAVLKIHGVLVGISSQGDDASRIRRYVTPLVDRGCKVIVCATRSRANSSSVTELEEIARESKPRFAIEWVEKPFDATNRAAGNRKCCAQLVSIVMEEVEKLR